MPGQYDRSAKTTRPYLWANGQHLATAGAAAVRSAPVAAIEVCLCAAVAGYVKIGDAAVTASAPSRGLRLFGPAPRNIGRPLRHSQGICSAPQAKAG